MKLQKAYIVLLFSLSCISSFACGERVDLLRLEITQVVRGKKATVGVACRAGDVSFSFNDTVQYPLMSVFKFHVALAALQKMESERTDPRSEWPVTASQMHANTYSPLKRIYPEGDFRLSFAELIRYCVSESDNNACDILIDYVGGIAEVGARIGKSGMAGCHLSETEATMHADLSNCYKNRSTPSSMVRLLHRTYTERVLSPPYDSLLRRAMFETVTGADKMRKGLPAGVRLEHKTGSSDRLGDGRKIGDNDAGVMYLPDGEPCFVAIFIKDSEETDAVNARMIADIAGCIYRFFLAARTAAD